MSIYFIFLLFFKQQKKPFLWLSLVFTDLLFVYFFSTFFLLSLNKKSQFPAYYRKNILPLSSFRFFNFLFFRFSFLFFIFLIFFFSFCLLFSSSTYFPHSSPILRLCSILAPSSCRVVSFTCRVFLFCSLRRILCSRSTVRLRFSHISSLVAIRPLASFSNLYS